jgi:hypothetical protein
MYLILHLAKRLNIGQQRVGGPILLVSVIVGMFVAAMIVGRVLSG